MNPAQHLVTPTFVIGPDDQSLRLIQSLRNQVLKYPSVATAIFDHFAAEGSRFAATAEGAELMRAMSESVLIANVEQVFDYATLGLLAESGEESGSVLALADAIFELGLRDDPWQFDLESSRE